MAQVYKFQVSMPVTDVMPRNRIQNIFHMEHVAGGLLSTDLEDIAGDIIALYQAKLGLATKEVQVKVYDVSDPPNYPLAEAIVNPGQFWTCAWPREICLCLSYSGDYRGNKNERGRMYLQNTISTTQQALGSRPVSSQMAWALGWYTTANESFPDLGGVDWKFGVYSRALEKFTQSTQAWVNDEWDVQRHRGLRENTRQTAEREG